MESQRIEIPIRFAWAKKMSFKSTIENILENIQRTFCKLREMKRGRFSLKRYCVGVFSHTLFHIFPESFPLAILAYKSETIDAKKVQKWIEINPSLSLCPCQRSYANNQVKGIRGGCKKIYHEKSSKNSSIRLSSFIF